MLLSVINFSEGRHLQIYQLIDSGITQAGGCVMHFSLDEDHNRGVLGFFADGKCFADCVIAAGKVAVSSIDLTKHQGQHPRFGAMDVVPVVPLSDTPMEEAIRLSETVARRLADEIDLPVYLYENSAQSPLRKDLATVRRLGQGKEQLTEDAEPDFGPPQFHPTAGAVAVGARGPLVAYNINLPTGDIALAKAVALKIREARKHGQLPGVKAIGLYLGSKGCAQISTNVTLPDECPPVKVWDFVQSHLPEDLKAGAVSELIGIASREHIRPQDERTMSFLTIAPEQWLETFNLHY